MNDFVELSPELLNDPDTTLNFFQTSELKRKNKLLQLYLTQLLKGNIQIEKALVFLRGLTTVDASFQLLLDQIYQVSQILPPTTSSNQGQRKIFKQLLVGLNDRLPALQRSQMFEYLDEDTLYEAQLLNQQVHQKRKQQINTSLNYYQTKYAMMKDENEGFSKLLIEIQEASQNKMEEENVDNSISNILSLIGYFDLDPDRVVDLIVESWIHDPNRLSFLRILKEFKQVSVAHFLGRRFEQLLSSIGNNQHHFGVQTTPLDSCFSSLQTDQRVPPQNLIRTTCLAIKYGLFEIQHIWRYLSPSDEDMQTAYASKCEQAQKYFKSFDQLRPVDELEEGTKGEKLKQELFDQYLYNQKLWLLQGLLHVNCFDVFLQLFYVIGGNIDLTNFVPLKKTISDFIEWVIDPLYSKICYSKLFPSRQATKYQIHFDPKALCRQIPQYYFMNSTFFDTIEDLIGIFHPYIAEYPMAFTKLTRVLQSNSSPDNQHRIEQIIMKRFFPAMSSRDNLPITKLLWKYAQKLEYRKRYLYYSEWKDEDQFTTFLQMARGADLTKVHMRQVFNKLDKESKEKMTMKLAKITHSQPLQAMNELRRDRAQNSDNNPFMIHALSLVSGPTLDILVFSIVQWINDFTDEKKIKPKDIEYTQWYKNIALFMAFFYKKYFNVEMQGFFDHICDGLNQKQLLKPELLLLKELIEKMTGIVQIEDLNHDQVQALAGGRYIQLETTHQANDWKKSRKSNQALEQFFWQTTALSQKIYNQDNQEEQVSLAFLLFVILCQQRNLFIKQYTGSNLRPLSVVFDNFTWSINQLTKCLLFQTDKPTHYAQLFPKNPLHRLVIDFKIPFELAFRIVRYSHKSLYNMNDEEFIEVRNQIKDVYDKIDYKLMFDNPGLDDNDQLQLPVSAHTEVKEKLWNYVSADLFALFWLLSVDNIYVPQSIYEKVIKQQQDNLKQINEQKERQTTKAADQRELAKQQKACKKSVEKLQSEMQNNIARKEQFEAFFLRKKEYFYFKYEDKETDSIFSSSFCQLCVLPRLLIDPSEAMYCAKFIHALIRISNCKYNYRYYISRDIVQYILPYLQCATEQETVNLSVFINMLMQPFANWNEESKYKADMRNYFASSEDGREGNKYEKEKGYIIQTLFMKICLFIKLLKNNETQARNSLIFLKNTLDIFPPTQQIADIVKQYTVELGEAYKDIQDIQVRVRTYKLSDKYSSLPTVTFTSISSAKPEGETHKQSEPAKDYLHPHKRGENHEAKEKDNGRNDRDISRDIRDRETRDKDQRDIRDSRDTRDSNRERDTRDRGDQRDVREGRDNPRDKQDGRDVNRDNRDQKDRDQRESNRDVRDRQNQYSRRDYDKDKDNKDKGEKKDNGRKFVDNGALRKEDQAQKRQSKR